MKNVTVNLSIQFDILEGGDIMDRVQDALGHINIALQEAGLNCQPQLLTNSLDRSDIVDGDDEDRESKIEYIKRVINDFGETTSGALALESSPCVTTAGNETHLAEDFNEKTVGVVAYVNDEEVNSYQLEYEDLDDDTLDEVYQVMKDYEEQQS